jgi:hypothetical protein
METPTEGSGTTRSLTGGGLADASIQGSAQVSRGIAMRFPPPARATTIA